MHGGFEDSPGTVSSSCGDGESGLRRSGPQPVGEAVASFDALRREYEAYCRREALGLVSLIPRWELGEFVRRAKAWAEDRDRTGGQSDPKDPLRTATAFARHLLPLPPFALWVGEFLSNRATYLDALAHELLAPRSRESLTVHRRRLRDTSGDWWSAALRVRRGGEGWVGHIRFEAHGRPTAITADVFREATIQEVHDRFLSFRDETLQAFLRSSLP